MGHMVVIDLGRPPPSLDFSDALDLNLHRHRSIQVFDVFEWQ
jgi:hypothetical protein